MRLIMILISMTIIAILAVGMAKLYFSSDDKNNQESAIDQAYDARRISDLQALQTAIITFYTTEQDYPNKLDDLIPQYASSLPLDPKTDQEYGYKKNSSGFELYCVLGDENKMKNDGGNSSSYYEVGDNLDL